MALVTKSQTKPGGHTNPDNLRGILDVAETGAVVALVAGLVVLTGGAAVAAANAAALALTAEAAVAAAASVTAAKLAAASTAAQKVLDRVKSTGGTAGFKKHTLMSGDAGCVTKIYLGKNTTGEDYVWFKSPTGTSATPLHLMYSK